MKKRILLLVAALVLLSGGFRVVAAEPPAKDMQIILSADNYWRIHAVVREAEVPLSLLKEKQPEATAPKTFGPSRLNTSPPPADWMKPEFDDREWSRSKGPFPCARGSTDTYWPEYESLLCLRGRFEVKDPGGVGKIILSARYGGGVVVYLNGKEVFRAHLPAGEIKPDTPAEPYPVEAYIEANGNVMPAAYFINGRVAKGDKDLADRAARRDRDLGLVELPVKELRKGCNLLAVELHRGAYRPEALKWGNVENKLSWPHLELRSLRLAADGTGQAIVAPSRPGGIQVWNEDVHNLFGAEKYGDPSEPLRPMRLAGARNGYYSGEVVVGSSSAFDGLKAHATDLAQEGGAGRISATNIRVRGATLVSLGVPSPAFAALENDLPAKVEVTGGKDKGAVQPVWITVYVPKDAPPGNYKGGLVLSASGLPETNVPVELEVTGWTLPDAGDYRSFVGIYQSPESVALQYGVPMWSDEHWKRMEKSFELMGYLGNKLLVVTLVTQTQFGNDESMVKWIRRKDGSFTYDFAAFDRYLALAKKYCNLRVISFQVWHVPGNTPPFNFGASLPDKPTFVTVVDEAAGKAEPMPLPIVGTAESKNLWKPLLDQIRDRLKTQGLDKITPILGISADGCIHKDVVAQFKELWPEARWHYGAHGRGSSYGGKDSSMGYFEYLYVPNDIDPPELPGSRKRLYYWWTPHPHGTLIVGSQRIHDARQPPMSLRTMAERYMLLGDKGAGRMCMDYWPAGKGGKLNTLFDRWPASSSMQRCPLMCWLAVPDKDGARPTVKIEMLREGLQEAEARACVELPLVENKLDAELAERCRRLLDKRADLCRITHFRYYQPPAEHYAYDDGWRERSAKLYRMAAEVAGKENVR
ncbi:MAG: glycoside hydrolase domain-containing protein [Planctomycetota bacterium]